MKNKYKLSTKISVYIAVILSLAMSGLTIRSLIVKRNVHSVSVTLYGIVFVSLLVVSAVSLIVYIYKSKIGIYVSIACLVIIFVIWDDNESFTITAYNYISASYLCYVFNQRVIGKVIIYKESSD